jgi:uncharacterized protein with FMN-binding domain
MRRAMLSLAGLVAGTTLLVSLKSAPGASRLPGQVAADNAALAVHAAVSATPTPGGGPVDGLPSAPEITVPTASGAPATTKGPTPKPTATATRPPTAPKPPSGQPTNTLGDSYSTEFGYVTVGVTLLNGKLTAVFTDELPADEPRSKSLSDKWGPVLCQRALTAQSTTFDTATGATYTSLAFKQSLQSAFDKAGFATR